MFPAAGKLGTTASENGNLLLLALCDQCAKLLALRN